MLHIIQTENYDNIICYILRCDRIVSQCALNMKHNCQAGFDPMYLGQETEIAMVWPHLIGLAKTILQGTVKGKRIVVDRRRGGKTRLRRWTVMDFANLVKQLKTGLGGKGLS